MDVVQVVGRAQPQPELLAEAREHLVDLVLPVDAVALDFEEEAVGAEDVAIRCHRFARAIEVAVRYAARRLALEAA